MTKKENEKIVVVMDLGGNIEGVNSVDTGTAKEVRKIINSPQKCVSEPTAFSNSSVLKVPESLGTQQLAALSNHQKNLCYNYKVICDFTGCRLVPIPCPTL